MDTVAYWLALLTVVAVPPFMLVWYIVHPFNRFWRRIGTAGTYISLVILILTAMWFLYSVSGPVMKVRYGVNWLLVILAVQVFAVSMVMGFVRMRQLRPSVMLGLPEISPEAGPGKLLTEGIYSVIRHPRYVEVWLGLAAVALFTNYLAVYILAAVFIPLIYGVVLLEERELRERFGREYEAYCAQVPRFFPRRHPR